MSDNDFSVFAEWGVGTDGKLYLLDMIRGKWEELQKSDNDLVYACKLYALKKEMERFLSGQVKVEQTKQGALTIKAIKVSIELIAFELLEWKFDAHR